MASVAQSIKELKDLLRQWSEKRKVAQLAELPQPVVVVQVSSDDHEIKADGQKIEELITLFKGLRLDDDDDQHTDDGDHQVAEEGGHQIDHLDEDSSHQIPVTAVVGCSTGQLNCVRETATAARAAGRPRKATTTAAAAHVRHGTRDDSTMRRAGAWQRPGVQWRGSRRRRARVGAGQRRWRCACVQEAVVVGDIALPRVSLTNGPCAGPGPADFIVGSINQSRFGPAPGQRIAQGIS